MVDRAVHDAAASALAGFRRSLKTAAACQQQVLAELVRENASSRFGVEHGFSRIRTLADYRRAVPIRQYGTYSNWLERAAQGEPALTVQSPKLFLSSSGSTGAPKVIPLTARYVERVFSPFFLATLGSTVSLCPEAFAHDAATLNLKSDPLRRHGSTSSGAPLMGASQVDFARQFGRALLEEPGAKACFCQIPATIASDLDRLYYKLRLAAEHDLKALVGINPALVMAVPGLLELWWERLIRELAEGTILGQRCATPAPERARLLSKRRPHYDGRLPALLWPGLEMLFYWNGGTAVIYNAALRRAFGGERLRILPAPLACSEGPITAPIDADQEGSPLFIDGVLYEFVPAECDLQEDAQARGWDELDVGSTYHVIISHVGGMYRYAVGDVVRVVGHAEGVPRLAYACRDRAIGVGGWTLRESNIVDATRRALEICGLSARGFLASVEAERIHFAIEPAEGGALPARESVARALRQQLEGQCLARSRAAAQQFAQPSVDWLERGALLADWMRRVGAGLRPPQAKDRLLVSAAELTALLP